MISEEYVKEFGELLRELRLQHGYSLNELSEKIGIYAGYLYRLEENRTHSPSVTLVVRLANFFDIDPNIMIRAVLESGQRRKINERENNVEKR
ncbi:helix-turn-helix transcriptional regulator [Anoxybacillus ayderensis]|uniref:helix-turn-helix domain-containing protein n=1 Tax=Anoxybacillus ayderensis TaxID=265546 RepID=UPI002E21550B|nr:helix-turn-helix transcriptional regulator [Anoxybacillus ayderensis]MED0687603.1 helix-turn-helix transcriptional regulator [Anoxybacillus ayderensis]